jgi:signal transduction histidine kinase
MARLGPEPLDLSRAVSSIVDDFLPLAVAADVHVRTQLGADVHAIADRSALKQMVLNLLDNAVKYGPREQTITIATLTVSTPDGLRARIHVDDQGDGIPPRERERVWSSFYRLDRHASSSVAGSGIGLYVVRELARQLDGDAWVDDAPGTGARIVVDLPAAQRAHGFTDEHPSAQTMGLSTHTAGSRE